jgi:hypothetical protein
VSRIAHPLPRADPAPGPCQLRSGHRRKLPPECPSSMSRRWFVLPRDSCLNPEDAHSTPAPLPAIPAPRPHERCLRSDQRARQPSRATDPETPLRHAGLLRESNSACPLQCWSRARRRSPALHSLTRCSTAPQHDCLSAPVRPSSRARRPESARNLQNLRQRQVPRLSPHAPRRTKVGRTIRGGQPGPIPAPSTVLRGPGQEFQRLRLPARIVQKPLAARLHPN